MKISPTERRKLYARQNGECPLCTNLMHIKATTATTIESKRPRPALICYTCATGKPLPTQFSKELQLLI